MVAQVLDAIRDYDERFGRAGSIIASAAHALES
jgi:hypothetical protein